MVLSGSDDGSVCAWDLVDGKLLARLDHTKAKEEEGDKEEKSTFLESLASATASAVHSLSFHPERCELMTAARGSVHVWKREKDLEPIEEEN